MLRPTGWLALCFVSALSAQEKIDARRFMVHDYTNVIAADIGVMQELGIWDDLEVSALKLAFSMAEKELGFPLENLERFTMTMSFADAEERERGARTMRMFVLEGREPLALPENVLEMHEANQHGAYTLYQREWDRDSAFVVPTPKLQVWGDAEVIKQALDGKRKPGLPSADVMSLSVGKGKRLAYLVADLSERAARKTFLEELFEGSEWPEDDKPTFFAGRVLVTGDEDDYHLVLELTMRHAKAGDGVAASDQAVDALIKRGLEMPQLRMFRKMLKGAEKKVNGSDVVVRVDLGRSRHAVGNLAMVMAPLFMLSAAPVEAQAVQVGGPVQVEEVVEEVELVEEPPPPPPPEELRGGGGGDCCEGDGK